MNLNKAVRLLLFLRQMKRHNKLKKRIALVGGGPSALFVYKRLVDSGAKDLHIFLFEKKAKVGSGMPYSEDGANDEHITNVSDNEIPGIVSTVEEWLHAAPPQLIQRFGLTENNFSEYKVLPRLLFGHYLAAQFALLHEKASQLGLETDVCTNTIVTDLIDQPADKTTTVVTNRGRYTVDAVVICTGHVWPKENEGKVPGWFDSPYPPSKLELKLNEPVAIKGASLTAIDAVRTLARTNGEFRKLKDGRLSYQLARGSENFRLVLHSLDGLLPALRVHLANSYLSNGAVLSDEDIAAIRQRNNGFVPLDDLYRYNFLEPLRQRDPAFYDTIKDLPLEAFVGHMMERRERLDPFTLLKAEYAEAETSIRRRQPVFWKEMLAVLSFAMNHPAKHLPAEDMLRLKNVLMPLISVVIAFVPQSSAQKLLALHEAGVLSLQAVDRESSVVPGENGGAVYRFTADDGLPQTIPYGVFIDCTGQPAMRLPDFPFKGLVEGDVVSQAMLPFRNAEKAKEEKEKGNAQVINLYGNWYLKLPGLAINDYFQVLDQYNATNPRVYIMAVPYIAGFNPDYSGLDFCEAASAKIAERLLQTEAIDLQT